MRMVRTFPGLAIAALAVCWAVPLAAQPLTADRAAQIALERSTQVIQARAGVLDARAGLYGAWSGVLPSVSASLSRSGAWATDQRGRQVFGTFPIESSADEDERYATTPSVTGRWSVLNLSSLAGVRSARSGVRAARYSQTATRQDVAFSARRQFYEVVRTEKLSGVAAQALRLARDDERRVRALFEVGSVSRSDLLKAQVRTAQGELDSLTARQAVISQRIVLANLLGLSEREMGEVDTVLTAEPRDYDEAALLAEAEQNRPDLRAAEAELAAARSNRTAARLLRLPYVTVSGAADFSPRSSSRTESVDSAGVVNVVTGRFETERELSAQVALNWDIFTGLQIESRNAAARARLMRAQEDRDALRRNLADEVHEALLAYREALERQQVARRAVESAEENVNLTQQKYNVGSATILELIDAQVQLQRALSDQVSALAAIRIAEAQLERVRGRGE